MDVERAARWVALPAGVLAISTSSILIRLTVSAPLTTATYRMFVAAAILLAVAAIAGFRDLRALDRRSLGLLGLSGGLLGIHFALWTTALFHTTVASAVFLVDTHPVIVALLARWVLAEHTRVSTWVGIGLTMAGGALIATSDFRAGVDALLGDAMAIGAAAAFAGYLVIGRHVRQELSTPSYAGSVYALAGVVLLVLALASGSELVPASPRDPLIWLALVLIPTLAGHTVFNWALRHVPASIVGVSILGEPVISTTLAWLVLGEHPTPSALVGGLIVLIGLFVALRSRNEP